MTTINHNLLPSSFANTQAVKDNYLDQNSLNAVKVMGRHNDPAALKEIAKKFEAMFVQQMLKSMRDANEVFADGDLFSSQEVKFHQEMMDHQMVLNLTSGEGIGMAKAMFEQMAKAYGKTSAAATVLDKEAEHKDHSKPVKDSLENTIKPLGSTMSPSVSTEPLAPPPLISRAGIKKPVATSQEEFITQVKPFADQAAAELNVSADVILAQAALETGWGKKVIHDAQGKSTFNLFNIKALGWNGKSVSVNTLENKQGITTQERAEFRGYQNYAQSFADYVSLIKNNPRYQQVLASGFNSTQYADALQRAGYATDPHYAEKIKRILSNDAIRDAVSAIPQTVDGLANNALGEES